MKQEGNKKDQGAIKEFYKKYGRTWKQLWNSTN